jgi:diaminopimelate decarboxylase/aspartate kinase
VSEQVNQPWLVMKFGGTSVSSKERWQTIIAQAQRARGEGHKVLVVVSALSGVTNLLTSLADSANPAERTKLLAAIAERHAALLHALEMPPSELFSRNWQSLLGQVDAGNFPLDAPSRAALLAHGELLSSAIGTLAFESRGLQIHWQDARQFLQAVSGADGNPLAVRCTDDADPVMSSHLADQGDLHITQGFIARNKDGATCLLGRGGSDTSAAYFAARLQAASLEIWTDVPGMFTADPRVVPDARLLNSLGYREAQELASMGAKVLHPPSIQPVRRHSIPLYIKDTGRPTAHGTLISAADREAQAQVKGVVSRKGIVLINMENPSMWQQAGFLADAFSVFKQHGFSVDLVSTSESAVTVTLDPESAADTDGGRLARLLDELAGLCRVELHQDCVSISLVGNAIRTILGRLSSALEVFQDRHVHMVTQSANDLNLTLVVDPDHAEILVRRLHQLLISSQAEGRVEFGPSWSELNQTNQSVPPQSAWWRACKEVLLDLLANRDCAFVYDLGQVSEAATRLLGMRSVKRVLYSLKANDHPAIVRLLAQQGLGFECVSLQEVQHVLQTIPQFRPADILFTPNFASRGEYQKARVAGVTITIDNAWVLQQWPGDFAGMGIFLRLDLESGHGHHKKVITSGKDSKFGISLDHLDALQPILNAHEIQVIGLHAHTGSGVNDASVWREQLQRLLKVLPKFPRAKVLDLGGGLGVPERPMQSRLDLTLLDQMLAEVLAGTDVQVWLEPGRYLVAESGVLLARVNQLKNKGHYHYVGLATGMNSLIRPALYGAYHDIVNLSRMDEKAVHNYRIVGPICESADVLGESRLLPECREGDILLIANAGAYGRVMSSHYNRRAPADELVLEA